MNIHEMKQERIVSELRQLAAYIRSNDSSYERELKQVYEIEVMLANLVRYATAIDERNLNNN